ncbi:MAG: hypothetical protein IKN62_06015 [Elusimicrobia bacterium]|nr:hypothetical protein [Elusimicrobiota bacterium]
MKNIVIISVEHRKNTAVAVQEVLSEYGCLIKTRLGITGSTPKKCSQTGLIILEFLGNKREVTLMTKKLSKLSGVKVKAVSI